MKSKIERYIAIWANEYEIEHKLAFKDGANLLLPMLLECLGALQQYYPLAAYDRYSDEFNVFVAKQTINKINKQVSGL